MSHILQIDHEHTVQQSANKKGLLMLTFLYCSCHLGKKKGDVMKPKKAKKKFTKITTAKSHVYEVVYLSMHREERKKWLVNITQVVLLFPCPITVVNNA